MPPPPPTFTKSKWLAFFAELTAKITHHHYMVVLDGCDVLRRLLTTRVSVGTVLEEGTLLQHLLDTMVGNLRQARSPTTPVDVELQFALVSTVEHVLDLMLALHADGDGYYCLLVTARAGTILDALTQAIQAPHKSHLGVLVRAACSILKLKLGKVTPIDGLSTNINVVRHVQGLEDLVAKQPVIVRELFEVAQALARAASEGPAHVVACYLANASSRRLQKMTLPAPTSGGGEPCDISVEVNAAPDAVPLRTAVAPVDVRRSLAKIGSAKSHHDFFVGLGEVWCYTVATPDILLQTFSEELDVKNFARFLEVAPQTSLDAVLFRSILSWLSFVIHRYTVSPAVVTRFGRLAASSLMHVIAPETRTEEWSARQWSSPASRPPSASNSSPSHSTLSWSSSVGNNTSLHPASASQTASCSKPNVCLPALNFLTTLERSCEDSVVAQWLESGLLGLICDCILQASEVKSVLTDAPTTVDGSLCDEVYLQCALSSTRSQAATVAVVACKMLSALIETRIHLLRDIFASECTAVIQPLIPTLLRMAIHNPTLSAAQENQSASIIHHVPRCTRAARHTSIGECSVVALDALFHLANALAVAPASLLDVMQMIPALVRATRNSIIPHLRGTAYRVVVRLCTEPAHLVMIAREMPSITQNAVTAVLQYSMEAPQWESAAAAEWIAHVILTVADDPRLEESFNFTLTTLPIKLLQLAAASGISYSTASLLSLITALFEQEQRLREHETTAKSNSVLAPFGKRSIGLWLQLLGTATHANQLLRRICANVSPLSIPTSDTLARAQSTFEDVAVQMTYSACVARSIIFLIRSHVSHRDQLDDEVVFAFVESVLALPTPLGVQAMVSERMSVTVQLPDQLVRSYNEAVRWSAELGAAVVDESTSTTRPTAVPWLPSPLVAAGAAVMGDDAVDQATRINVVHFINTFLKSAEKGSSRGSGGRDEFECLEPHSEQLFSSSLTLADGSCVHGLRCRLVASFAKANAYAVESGWLSQVAAELRHICDVFAEQKEFNSDEMEKLAVCLSLCCSVLSFPGCQGVANTSDAEVLSYGLSFFLREKSTRMLTQHGLKGIVRTPEGRRVTLVTSTLAGSTAAASLFQRLVAIAFHVPRHSAAAAAPAAGLRSSTSVGTTPEVLLALEIAAVCLGHPDGGDGFSHAVQKVRGLDALERWVLALDKQRTPLPMAFMRFLCALSFHADAQLQIAQKEDLMTVLIEASGACNERGSLCLFVLRNMCFHSSLKTQMCQDSRFLVVAKSALMLRTQAVDLSAPQGSGSGGGGSGSWSAGRQTMEVATGGAAGQEAYRRQEIAASALWALVYNNQRAKTYVRGLLKQATPVSLKSATVVDFVSTPALRSYATLMNQNISGLASLGLD